MADALSIRHLGCATCGSLRNYERAVQYVQEDEPDSQLPEAIGGLRSVPTFPRGPDLMRCPECGTWYLYETAYEFLIGFGGSYDEQTITRLSDEEAIGYLAGNEGSATEPQATSIPGEEAMTQAVLVYAARLTQAHFAHAGREFVWKWEPTSSWFIFGLHLDNALIPHTNVLQEPDYLSLLRQIFADLFDFFMITSAGNPAPDIAELHRAFGSGIDCGPILPLLLPERARLVLEEVDQILDALYEEERIRQDQMGY